MLGGGRLSAIPSSGTIGDAIKQARDNPLAKNGTNQHSDLADRALEVRENPLCEHGKAGRGVDNIKPTKGGTDTTYTLRRLARDNPELLDTSK